MEINKEISVRFVNKCAMDFCKGEIDLYEELLKDYPDSDTYKQFLEFYKQSYEFHQKKIVKKL